MAVTKPPLPPRPLAMTDAPPAKTQEELDAEELEAMMADAGNSIAQFEAERADEIAKDAEKDEAETGARRAADAAKKAEQQKAIEKEQKRRMKAKRAERRKENAQLGVHEEELDSDSASDAESVSESDDEDEANAATRIQSMRRGKAARKDLEGQKAATLKIQAMQRGKMSRALSAQELEEQKAAALKDAAAQKDLEDQAAAALKIQAMQRGKMSRAEQEAAQKDLEDQKAAALKIQAMQRGKLSRAELEEQKAAKIQAMHRGNKARKGMAGVAEVEDGEEAELAVGAEEDGQEAEEEYANDPGHQPAEVDRSSWRKIPVNERQDAILHMLAAYDVDNATETDFSDTASEASQLPPGAQSRNFFKDLNQYARKTSMGKLDRQKRVMGDLEMVEQMLLASQRMHEADQVRALMQELVQPPEDNTGKSAKQKFVSSENFLSFLQKQAQGRASDPLMGKIKDVIYEEDPDSFDRLPPIPDALPLEAGEDDFAPGGRGDVTRLPSLSMHSRPSMHPEAGGGDEDDSLLVDAELLKYWEAAAGEAGEEFPMFQTKKKKSAVDASAHVEPQNQTFDQFKSDMKERKSGTGALSRPLHGINSVDKSFYGLLHTSSVGVLIQEDTRANWAMLTRSLASAGANNKSASAVAEAVEEAGAQGREMYAPPRANTGGNRRASQGRGPQPRSVNSTMNSSTFGRPASGKSRMNKSSSKSKSKRGNSPGTGGRILPDHFLKQCVSLAVKAGPDQEEQEKIVARFESHGVDIETSNKDGNTLLMILAGTPDVDVTFTRLLVQHSAATVAKNNLAQSALHVAAAVGNVPVARFYLGAEEADAGAGASSGAALIVADVEDIYNETPLHHASRHGHVDMIALLLYHGADPDNESAKNQTPLVVAAECSQIEAADRLIQWGAAIGFEDADGATPLHKACKSGALTLVKQLIEAEADVNALESDGFTSVHWACNQGHIVVLNLLCDRGAMVDLQDEDGETPLHRAVSCGHPEIAQELLERGANVGTPDKVGRDAVHKAANSGDVNSLKVVLEKHGNVNVRDKTGVTPLHLAAAHGHTGIANILLRHGAKVDLEDSKGRTPIHYAANGDQPQVAKVLLSHGAQCNYEDGEGWTALHWAAKRNAGDLGAILLETKADKNWKDLRGMTPLHRAVSNGNAGFVSMLIRAGAEVNARDCRGRTPLNVSVSNRRHECTILLVEGKSDVNSKDSWGHTSLHRAVAIGDVETAALVCAIGADCNAPDVEQRTPLMWAAENTDEAMVRMLLSQGADAKLRDCNNQVASSRSDAPHLQALLAS